MIQGRLELVFTPDGERTSLTHARVVAPLKIVRPFALEDGRALVQMLTLGPGLCGGDCSAIDVTVEAGARAVLVAQSASRILGMSDGLAAAQTVRLTVRSGGQLEYYPGLTIPFPGSSFVQRVHVAAEAGARVGVLESWAMGRSGCGEYLQFRRVFSHTTFEVDGTPIYSDVVDLEPGSANLAGAGILDNHRYLASGYWYGATLAAPIARRADQLLLAAGHAAADQVYVRALANDGYGLRETLQAAIGAIHAGWRLHPIPIHRFTA